MKCFKYYSKKQCYECDLLAKNKAFNKRNQEYQELIAQIDCTMILCVNKELPDSIYHKYSQISNFNKWINNSFNELNTCIKKQENYPKKFHSNNLDSLLNYYKKEIQDSKYQHLVKNYLRLGNLLEKIEEYEIKNWMIDYTQYIVNKTMEEK